MPKYNIVPPDVRQFIIENSSMTGEELRQLIKEKYQVDVNVNTVLYHAKKARQVAEETTKTADAYLSQIISKRVSKFAPKILKLYEREIERIGNILDGTDPDFILERDETGSRDKYWAARYMKLLDDLSKSYLALRPPVQTLKLESTIDPDVAYIENMTDEQLKLFEQFIKSLEDDTNEG